MCDLKNKWYMKILVIPDSCFVKENIPKILDKFINDVRKSTLTKSGY